MVDTDPTRSFWYSEVDNYLVIVYIIEFLLKIIRTVSIAMWRDHRPRGVPVLRELVEQAGLRDHRGLADHQHGLLDVSSDKERASNSRHEDCPHGQGSETADLLQGAREEQGNLGLNRL